MVGKNYARTPLWGLDRGSIEFCQFGEDLGMCVLDKGPQVLYLGIHDMHFHIWKPLQGSNTWAIVNELGRWGYFISSGVLNPLVILRLGYGLG